MSTISQIITESINIATDYGQRSWMPGKEPIIRDTQIVTWNGFTFSFTSFPNDASLSFVMTDRTGKTVNDGEMSNSLALATLPDFIARCLR